MKNVASEPQTTNPKSHSSHMHRLNDYLLPWNDAREHFWFRSSVVLMCMYWYLLPIAVMVYPIVHWQSGPLLGWALVTGGIWFLAANAYGLAMFQPYRWQAALFGTVWMTCLHVLFVFKFLLEFTPGSFIAAAIMAFSLYICYLSFCRIAYYMSLYLHMRSRKPTCVAICVLTAVLFVFLMFLPKFFPGNSPQDTPAQASPPQTTNH